ncbi:MAG: type II toxin-antitoxin system VapC family toxin [Candidatus Parabeggiatoa sp. nov. 3]|jgi:predicted nucleic acid-binding protein|nr:MAG: type II toxin-antitoxin system VapC family toxin [Gammaproteobacteria bacterium]RKZ64803.1 MAG: type II toxin-antitoxin system VapC family toxin [Gammaproteobacteria bacterium]RKZ81302.1 MAG: type II toxin-antitoxin system VapC family toxin [Gammaproteobacteria bacterium]
MGVVLDTGAIIKVERSAGKLSFSAWADYGDAYISVITCSELLVGVHKANTTERRIKRAAFVEGLLASLPILEFDLETARVHAETLAALPKEVTIGAHDLLIGATAIRHGFPVLTTNVKDFSRIPGLEVLEF